MKHQSTEAKPAYSWLTDAAWGALIRSAALIVEDVDGDTRIAVEVEKGDRRFGPPGLAFPAGKVNEKAVENYLVSTAPALAAAIS
jgi:hypothetical protein